jgi:hypothetical protein
MKAMHAENIAAKRRSVAVLNFFLFLFFGKNYPISDYIKNASLMSLEPQRSSESGNGGVLVEKLLYCVQDIVTVRHNLSRQPYGRKTLHV